MQGGRCRSRLQLNSAQEGDSQNERVSPTFSGQQHLCLFDFCCMGVRLLRVRLPQTSSYKPSEASSITKWSVSRHPQGTEEGRRHKSQPYECGGQIDIFDVFAVYIDSNSNLWHVCWRRRGCRLSGCVWHHVRDRPGAVRFGFYRVSAFCPQSFFNEYYRKLNYKFSFPRAACCWMVRPTASDDVDQIAHAGAGQHRSSDGNDVVSRKCKIPTLCAQTRCLSSASSQAVMHRGLPAPQQAPCTAMQANMRQCMHAGHCKCQGKGRKGSTRTVLPQARHVQ
jgi:hypothetical protein